jgi:G3E family GTPase
MTDHLVPVTIITGYLGSGKTTLINWLLEHTQEYKVALILNEFGDVSLESQFITNLPQGMIELKGGCMCCLAADDVPLAINWILDTYPDTDYIFIEAAGTSDPEPILDTFNSDKLHSRVRVDSLACVIDAINFTAQSQQFSTVMTQLGASDFVILSKTQQLQSSQLDNIITQIRHIDSTKNIFVFDKSLDINIFLDQQLHLHSPQSQSQLDHHHQSHDHDHSHHHHAHDHDQLQHHLFQTSNPLHPQRLAQLLDHPPQGLVRAKGYFYLPQDHTKYLLQMVGTKYELLTRDWQPDESPQSNLLFLGTNSAIQAILTATAELCVSIPD